MWSVSARPEVDVTLEGTAGPVTIAAGTLLPAVELFGVRGMKGHPTGYCTAERKTIPDETPSPLGGLLFKIERSLEDGRACILDTNADGMADQGFLIDKGSASDRMPRPIKPVALNVASLRERETGNRVTIEVFGSSRPGFLIAIKDQGRSRHFDTINADGVIDESIQKVPKGATYPYDMVVYGAKLRILAVDLKARTITIETVINETLRTVPTYLIQQ